MSDFKTELLPQFQSYHGRNTESYIISPIKLGLIASSIDSAKSSILDLFATNVMDAIVSIKQYPFAFPYNAETVVKLGTYNTHIGGYQLGGFPDDFTSLSPYNPISTSAIVLNTDDSQFYNYEPYSQLSVYLPFVGFIDLPLSETDVLKIKYITDFATGSVAVFVMNDSEYVIYETSTNIGFDIPVSATNRREIFANYVRGAVSGAIGGVASAITGTVPTSLMAENAIQQIAGTLMQRPQGVMRGGIGQDFGQFISPMKPYAIITSPNVIDVNTDNVYRQTIGLPYCAKRSLASMSGYTKVGQVHVDIPTCLESEREEIESLLKDGVIL